MVRMKKTIRLLILIFGVSSFSWQSSLAGDEGQADFSSLREDWEAAQRASVSHQGSQALKHIVGMLKLGGQDTLVQDQVASFLRRQFIRGRGKIPVTWEIPQEVTDLSLHLRSTVGSQGDYDSVHLQGQTEGAEVTGLHLWFLRGTKKYLILSNDGENKWSMLPGQKTGTYNFHLANGGRHSALTPGAYRLLIELDNGKRVRGDFVVTQEMALPPAPDGKVKLVSPKGCQVNFRWRVPEEESFRTF